MEKRLVFFTDLDGTLLDHHSYSWDAAKQGLEAAMRAACPVVIVSSKTRAEIKPLHQAMGLMSYPYIVENGGAIYFPDGDPLRLGAAYPELLASLGRAALMSGAVVRGFAQMTVAEVAARTGLPLRTAALAHQREFDEPFVVESGDEAALAAAIRALGLECTRGGRFHHILGRSSKADAVERVMERYPGAQFIGLGDGLNDVGFLKRCDHAWLLPSTQTESLRALLPEARIAPEAGPRGWSAAILSELERA